MCFILVGGGEKRPEQHRYQPCHDNGTQEEDEAVHDSPA